MRLKKILAIFILVGLLSFAIFYFFPSYFFKPTKTTLESIPTTRTMEQADTPEPEVVATNLSVPWEIAFLPDGSTLVSQRGGELLHIDKERTVFPIEGVEHIGEGGLLGVALHPNFPENNWLYVYLTTATDRGLENRVERYVFRDNQLTEKTSILTGIPGARFHDGGRLAFGPDGHLYITTGDAQNEALAQDKQTLHGSILRVKDDGSIPSDNPFGSAVYSYGHRNVQGIAWDDAGRLWATEHGRSGIRSGYDELNLIVSGGNYGWPKVEGDETTPGMTSPVIHSGADETWAPSSMIYFEGALFFVGLRGSAVYKVSLEGEKATNIQVFFREEFGRLRAIKAGKDGFIYLTTSNTDGRGTPGENDDLLIRVHPDLFVADNSSSLKN